MAYSRQLDVMKRFRENYFESYILKAEKVAVMAILANKNWRKNE